jgi:hypothetical protein
MAFSFSGFSAGAPNRARFRRFAVYGLFPPTKQNGCHCTGSGREKYKSGENGRKSPPAGASRIFKTK